MDGNKDESSRCIEIALEYIHNNESHKALKFLRKAERLYPSNQARELINTLESQNNKNSSGTGQQSTFKDGQNEENMKNQQERTFTDAQRKTMEGDSSETFIKKEYSDDQLEAVGRIKKCKDFYEILGISRDANDVDLKKQYKKLAFQFHPDKNKAPGATEAFKAIGNAFSVLSDPDKRRQYDMCGSQDSRPSPRPSSQPQNYEYSRGFESDISAEELFNMFFGGGFPSGMSASSTYQRRSQRRFHPQEPNSSMPERNANYTLFMQMLPIVLLICLSLLSSLFLVDPFYSLMRTHKYAHERKTSKLAIPYYVKENFAAEYQGSIRKLEAQVEEEYISNLRSSCFKEKSYRESMIWRAKNFRDRNLEENAKNLKTTSCDTLNELYTEKGW